MGKIIIITFGFMAFALYEMSGGADFVPIAEEKRELIAAAAAEDNAIQQQSQQVAQAPKTVPSAPSVATTQVVLASAPAPVPARQSAPVPAPQVVPVAAAPTQDAPNAFTAVIDAAIAEAKAEDRLTAEGDAAVTGLAALDIREVTSARVNMRNGPGRNFDVVGKLTAGQTVEILQDPGNGWVKLKVEDNGRIGWMADFLLTAANN